MNALNHKWIGLAIVLLVTALAIAGCQPASQEQPAATQPPTAIPQPTATTRPTDTPQPTATTAPTATPQPTATPTAVPTDIVVAEGEANCPIEDFEEDAPLAIVNDPELGKVDSAFVIRFNFTCSDPYIKGKQIAIQDGYYLKDGTTYVWTSLQEAVTDEGGVWKGMCVTGTDRPSRCTFTGDGKYKGLLMVSEYNLGTSDLKYRITKSVAEKQPTATPTAAPTEIVVAEREANCPIEDFEEDAPLAIVNDPELGEVHRAFVISHNFACSEPYIKGKIISIQDGHFMKDDTYTWSGISEIITDEGGIWKGTYEVIHGISLGTLIGAGKYKGLLIFVEYDLATYNIKIRVTKQVEESGLITSAERLYGNWQPLSKSPDAMFLQFNPDGTCRQSSSLEGLTNIPEVECTYTFEVPDLVMTEAKVHAVPPCPSPTGRYEVWRVAGDQIRLDAVEDTCSPRRNSTIGVYQRILP